MQLKKYKDGGKKFINNNKFDENLNNRLLIYIDILSKQKIFMIKCIIMRKFY